MLGMFFKTEPFKAEFVLRFQVMTILFVAVLTTTICAALAVLTVWSSQHEKESTRAKPDGKAKHKRSQFPRSNAPYPPQMPARPPGLPPPLPPKAPAGAVHPAAGAQQRSFPAHPPGLPYPALPPGLPLRQGALPASPGGEPASTEARAGQSLPGPELRARRPWGVPPSPKLPRRPSKAS